MYKRVAIKKLGRKRSHRLSLIQNQIRTLFTNGVLNTTTQKAKVIKGAAQSLLSDMSKKDITLEDTRKFHRILGSKKLVEKATKYAKNEDHGVRVRKTGFRAGDNAEQSRLELIGFERSKKKVGSKEKEPKEDIKKSEIGRKANKNIDERKIKKIAGGKSTKSEGKATQIVRTRAGL